MSRSHRPERRRALSMICGVIFLAAAGPTSGAGKAFDGVYTGKRLLTKGPAESCPVEEDVSVTIRGDTLTFTNSALRNFAIGFNPHPDGSFNETYVDIGGVNVFIQGRITGDSIDADVTNAVCEHHWHLKKEHRGQ
ncbi:MAG: hypothetical protein JO110_05565 [Acetobacteraceae bacterium]|nr:hypothetical protein [Acetobacteraceae bacterium]